MQTIEAFLWSLFCCPLFVFLTFIIVFMDIVRNCLFSFILYSQIGNDIRILLLSYRKLFYDSSIFPYFCSWFMTGDSSDHVQITELKSTDRTLLRHAHESWLSIVQTDLTLCYKLGSMQLLHLDLIFLMRWMLMCRHCGSLDGKGFWWTRIGRS